MNRLGIRNQTHGVEFADNGPGRMMAKAFRRSHPEFKRRRIRAILQLKPSGISLGEIYALTFRK